MYCNFLVFVCMVYVEICIESVLGCLQIVFVLGQTTRMFGRLDLPHYMSAALMLRMVDSGVSRFFRFYLLICLFLFVLNTVSCWGACLPSAQSPSQTL